jgi:hypothetical protein
MDFLNETHGLLPWITSFINEIKSGPIFDIMIIKD